MRKNRRSIFSSQLSWCAARRRLPIKPFKNKLNNSWFISNWRTADSLQGKGRHLPHVSQRNTTSKVPQTPDLNFLPRALPGIALWLILITEFQFGRHHCRHHRHRHRHHLGRHHCRHHRHRHRHHLGRHHCRHHCHHHCHHLGPHLRCSEAT
jgi:hypothetical protein